MFSYHKPLLGEPEFDSPEELRLFRKRRVALGYRVFAAFGWGQMSDGHITARDPERPDHFWMLGHGVPFGGATVDKLVLLGPDGAAVDGYTEFGYMPAAYAIHAPIHDARPDVVSAAHTHTPYGTPFAALNQPFRPICQEACQFFERQPGSVTQIEDARLQRARIVAGFPPH